MTFTLPVTTDQILLSKIINGVLWSVISLIVTIIGGGLIVVLGSGVSWGRIANELIDEIQNILHYMGLNGVLVTVETILSGIFALIHSLLLCYLSITIGSTVARRHKVLASIGIFFGIQFALSIATSFVSFFSHAIYGFGSLHYGGFLDSSFDRSDQFGDSGGCGSRLILLFAAPFLPDG